MKRDYYLILHTKINSKRIEDLNISPEAIKFLQENTENKILDTSLCDDFLDLAPKAKGTRVKTSSCDDLSLKSFCPIKETINNVKKQPMEQEKILANSYLIRKKLISKIYKAYLQLSRKTKLKVEHIT